MAELGGRTGQRTFRLFVSSTFSDLQEERNALHARVFPKLHDLCVQNGARFQVIDLRWGVSTEAGLDQKTMPLCLAEIERCQRTEKPNFLVLLGDRYGWRPLPAEIPRDEFERIRDHVPVDDRPVLNEWYLRDDNARYRRGDEICETVYYLKPRAKKGPHGDTDEGWQAWGIAERRLGSILRSAAEQLAFSEADSVKYLASATEQEIATGALAVDDAAEHVYCFFRSIVGLPGDESSKTFEDLALTGTDQSGWVQYERDIDAANRLGNLKAQLINRVGDANVTEYSASWSPFQLRDRSPEELAASARSHCEYVPGGATEEELMERLPGQATTDHIEQLCADVVQQLSAAIESRFALRDERTPLQIEDEAHLRFAHERADGFVGREAPLDAISAHLASHTGRPLVVHGASGSGKSALMAKAALDAAGTGQLLMRFVGATATSSEGRSVIADLCRQIGVAYGDESEVPADFRELVQEFPRRLTLATADRPLTVFLDAVDQLGRGDPARTLNWLPAELPDYVTFVVSTLPGETLEALEAKRPAADFVELTPLPAPDAARLLNRWLAAADRDLSDEQRAYILELFQGEGLPLYLKLAFEEARLWRSDTVGDLGRDIPGIIHDNLFDRLDDPENHGEALVSRVLGYLAASRFGLAEDELLSVLSTDDAVKGWLEEQSARTGQALPGLAQGEWRIPVVLWARLYADLEPYLAERATEGATVLTFYHHQFADVARRAFVDDGPRIQLHQNLANYFQAQAVGEDGDWTGQDVRGLSELPYHLIETEDWEAVEDLLTDFRFMEQKVAEVGVVAQTDAAGKPSKLYTGVYELRDDFDHALRRLTGKDDDSRRRIIVTAADLGNGLEIRCPHCNRMIPWNEAYRGDEEFSCPLTGPDCGGPLKVNPFVVGEDRTGER